MTDSLHVRRRAFLLGILAIAQTITLGCREAEQIRTYSAPKEAKPVAKEAAPAAAPGEPTDRMLTAILQAGGQAYFFKVVGPIAEMDKREKEFNDFFAGIRIGDDGKAKWQLPAGWKEGGEKQMRLATLIVPSEDKPLEVAISALPWAGTPDGMLSNVNRWRGQLQLAPTDATHVGESTRELKAGDLTLTVVDLRGHSGSSGMMPPFAGGAVGAASRAAQDAPPPGLPPGHPPIESPPGAAPPNSPAVPAAGDVPKFTAPADWKALPTTSIRKAAFAIGDAEHGGLFTLTSFPTSAPSIAEPLPNVNRWRREVGLPDVTPEELPKSSESIEVNGKPATYVRAVPDPSQADQSKAVLATLAAMVKDGDQVWFFKLIGERSTVVAQEDAFKNFLKSVQFAADGGATDGNK